MDKLLKFIDIASGPSLHRINRSGSIPGKKYSGSAVESIGDNAIRLVCLTWSLSLYTSPFILPYLYHKGLISMSNPNSSIVSTLIKITTALFTVFGGGYVLRGFGRLGNADYISFFSKYSEVTRLTSTQIKSRKEELLSRFDFDFSRWPVEYSWYDSPNADPHKLPMPLERKSKRNTMDSLTMIPCNLISYVAVHTFGRRMMYPGSLFFLQKAMEPMLIDGRTRLIERFGAERFKVETHEKNHIDLIFVDRRSSSNEKGRKLVICCEGNAGFYEVGIMCTPMDSGYSVLGWNHPGFAGSTGLPFPSAEVSAMDTIMKFAHEKLEFKYEEIILFAWSIGGYPCSWGAMTYPDVSGVILDATFDDIVPLAVSKMPTSWKPLVINTVRNYFNLNISDQLSYYSGPIIFVRRLKDEIIHTVETDPVRTNRANDLLIKMLKTRFPHLVSDENPMWTLYDWLSGDSEHQRRVMNQNQVNGDLCRTLLVSYVNEHGHHYPVNIGAPEESMSEETKTQLLLFLASKHLIDFDSTHCTPLPRNMFVEPWNLFKIARSSSSYGKKDPQNKL